MMSHRTIGLKLSSTSLKVPSVVYTYTFFPTGMYRAVLTLHWGA